MGEYVLSNCKLYLGGFDLSGDMNKLELAYSAEMVDRTAFGSSSKQKAPGLIDFSANHEGFYQAGENKVDEVIMNKFATVNEIMTLCPTTGAAGEIGYSLKQVTAEYSPGGTVGEMFAFTLGAQGSSDVFLRGTILENGARTATGNGTARQLGAVAAGKRLYAVMHVLAVSGTNPTLDVEIESDDAEGFASPVTRLTFAQATAVGAQWLTPVDGPITDTWFRPKFTVGGTDNPSFTVAVLVGIL